MTLTTRAVLSVVGTAFASASGHVQPASSQVNNTKTFDWASGITDSKANQMYERSRTGLTGIDNYVLDNASLENAFGETITLASVKLLYIENTGLGNLTIAGLNGIVGATLTLLPGQAFLNVTGTGHSTATSQNTVSVTSGGGGAYEIIIIGATA